MASIEAIISASSQDEQDRLVERWREMIIAQLNSVGLIVRLCLYLYLTTSPTVANPTSHVQGAILAAVVVGTFS
jgi:uncharacterized membrane protein